MKLRHATWLLMTASLACGPDAEEAMRISSMTPMAAHRGEIVEIHGAHFHERLKVIHFGSHDVAVPWYKNFRIIDSDGSEAAFSDVIRLEGSDAEHEVIRLRVPSEAWYGQNTVSLEARDGTRRTFAAPFVVLAQEDTSPWAEVHTADGFRWDPPAACATKRSGKLYCWNGVVLPSEARMPATQPIRIPTPVDPVGHLTLTDLVACLAAEGGKAWQCWGLSPDRDFTAIDGSWATLVLSTHDSRICGLDVNRRLACDEDPVITETQFDDLGEGWREVPAGIRPPSVFEEGTWRSVSVEDRFACGIRDEGTLWCWPHTNFPNPTTQVGTASDWVTLATAQSWTDHLWKAEEQAAFVCGIRSGGHLSCAGRGRFRASELGWSDEYYARPIVADDVAPTGAWQSISTSPYHFCGIRHGALLCGRTGAIVEEGWPDVIRFVAVPIGSDTDWVSVSVSNRVICGIRQAGASLWCWRASEGTKPADFAALMREIKLK